jgi:hypothetical protein
MTGIFDGMAGALADVFGAPVRYQSACSGPRVIRSIFREAPVEVMDDMGRASIVVAPTWKVPATQADGIERGDEIEPQPGRRFRVLNRVHSGSPAADRFVTFEMEAVD